MQELIGKKVLSIAVAPGEDELYIQTEHEVYSFKTYSDCCSETWFADLLGVDALLGGTVKTVECRNLPTVVDGRCRQDEDCFYGVSFETDKGRADLIYRNSSNGYYGGNVGKGQLCDAIPSEANPITGDWTALSATKT